jgi:molecular chaperone HtpG
MEATEEEADLSLVDQFVVGFFSAFFADRVVVISKHNDDDKYILESDANKNFTIKKDESVDNIVREIMVALYLKEGFYEFFEEKKIKDLIKKHSEFVAHPINLSCEKRRKNRLVMMKIKTKHAMKKRNRNQR